MTCREKLNKQQKKTQTHLVLHSDLINQHVVCVPLLADGQAVIRYLVLGLQVASSLPCVHVTEARRVKLLHSEKKGDEVTAWRSASTVIITG